MNEQLELENDIDSPEEDAVFLDPVMVPFDPSKIDIAVESLSLFPLIERLRHGEIDMNTDFQRHADLWDPQKMSRLIESILIRFPLPAFYFDASDENNWLIVDGLQRLSSIRKFVVNKELRLSGLEFLKDLNGKTYDQLHRNYQRRINECTVTAYMIKPNTPLEVKYSVFRRINTGGLTLNNQEIRNALAKPRDRELLEKLAGLAEFKAMFGDISKRMQDQELVLRFWAFFSRDYLDKENKKQIASFLDQVMEDIKSGDEAYRRRFVNSYQIAMKRCFDLLGEAGFEKPSENGTRRRKNTALFEVWSVSLARLSEANFSKLLLKKELFRQNVTTLLQDNEFFNAVTFSTQKELHVRIRYNKVDALIKEFLND